MTRRFSIRMLTILACCALLSGCRNAPPKTDGYPIQTSLRGLEAGRLLSCAGPPLRQIRDGETTYLRYYREAPQFEESTVLSKGSRAGAHHGCWATVTLEQGRVEAVHYRFVPEAIDASNHCEEIFAGCAP